MESALSKPVAAATRLIPPDVTSIFARSPDVRVTWCVLLYSVWGSANVRLLAAWPELLVSQSDHRVYAHGSACRDVACGQGSNCQHC
jgi:hypothetical protein